MKTMILYAVALAGLTAFGAGDKTETTLPEARLTFHRLKKTIKLGEPMDVSLALHNHSKEDLHYFFPLAANGSQFEITGPDGKKLARTSFPCSTVLQRETLKAGQTKVVCRQVDLAHSAFLIAKPGVYTIRYTGRPTVTAGPDVAPADPVKITVTPGKLRSVDELALKLLPHTPKGWQFAKRGPHDGGGPTGWRSGATDVVAFIRSKFNAVLLYQSPEQLKPAPVKSEQRQAVYLGKGESGYLYLEYGKAAVELWPTLESDLRRHLLPPGEK